MLNTTIRISVIFFEIINKISNISSGHWLDQIMLVGLRIHYYFGSIFHTFQVGRRDARQTGSGNNWSQYCVLFWKINGDLMKSGSSSTTPVRVNYCPRQSAASLHYNNNSLRASHQLQNLCSLVVCRYSNVKNYLSTLNAFDNKGRDRKSRLYPQVHDPIDKKSTTLKFKLIYTLLNSDKISSTWMIFEHSPPHTIGCHTAISR